jgi:hypothetical protein
MNTVAYDRSSRSIDSEFDTEVDPVCEERVDPDEASEHDPATRFVDPECPLSGPLRRREFERKLTTFPLTGRSQP